MNSRSTENLLQEIAKWQDVQKRHHWTDKEWQDASDKLQPLFAEMARRQKAGSIKS